MLVNLCLRVLSMMHCAYMSLQWLDIVLNHVQDVVIIVTISLWQTMQPLLDVLYFDTTSFSVMFYLLVFLMVFIAIITVLRLSISTENKKSNRIDVSKSMEYVNSSRKMRIELEQRKIREYNYQSQINSLKEKLLAFHNMYKINDENFNKLAEIIINKEEKSDKQCVALEASQDTTLERIQQDNDKLRRELSTSNAINLRLNRLNEDSLRAADSEVNRGQNDEHEAQRLALKAANDTVRISQLKIQSHEEIIANSNDSSNSNIVSLYQKRNEILEEELELCKMNLFDLENVYNALSASVSSLKTKIQDQEEENMMLSATLVKERLVSADALAKVHQLPRTLEADKLLDETVIRCRSLEVELDNNQQALSKILSENDELKIVVETSTMSITELHQSLDVQKEENMSLKTKIDLLQEELQAIQLKYDTSNEQMKQLKGALDIKEKKDVETDHIVTFLKSSMAELQMKLRSSELTREDLLKSQSQHMQLIEDQKECIITIKEETTRSIEDQINTITAAKHLVDEEVLKMQEVIRERSAEVSQWLETIAMLTQERDKLQESASVLDLRRKAAEEELRVAREEVKIALSDRDNEKKNLTTDIAELRDNLLTMEKRCAEADSKANLMAVEKTISCQLIQNLNDELKTNKLQLHGYKCEMTKASLLNDQLQQSVATIEVEKHSIAMEQNGTIQDLIILRKELASRTSSEEAVKLSAVDLQSKVQLLETRLDEALAATIVVKSELDLSLTSNSIICNERDSIQAQLVAAKNNLSQQMSVLSERNSKLEARILETERESAVLSQQLAAERESVQLSQVLVNKAEEKVVSSQQVLIELEKDRANSQSDTLKLNELLGDKNKLLVVDDRLKQLQETIDEMRASNEANNLNTIISDLQKTNHKLVSDFASMMEEKQSLSVEVARLKTEVISKAHEQEADKASILRQLDDAEGKIVTLLAIKETSDRSMASMSEEISSLTTRIAAMDNAKVELENEIAEIESEKNALERKLRAVHLEDDTAVSSIFESSFYQGLDNTVISDSMNISSDANPLVAGSPRGLEYVRVAEETTKYLLNELDDLKRTKQTLERSIRDIRIKLTPKRTPRTTPRTTPRHKKSYSLSPKAGSETLSKAITPTLKSPTRIVLSPISLHTKSQQINNNVVKRVIKRKTISIDVDENDNENINLVNNNNAINNVSHNNNDNNNICNDENDNDISCISLKVKPVINRNLKERQQSSVKTVLRAASSRLKIGKINISNLLES